MRRIIRTALVVLTLFVLTSILGCKSPAPPVPDVPESAITGLWERYVSGKAAPEDLVIRDKGKCQWFTGDAWTDGTYGVRGNEIYVTWEYDVDVVGLHEHETFTLRGNKIRRDGEKSNVYYLRVATLDQIKDEDYPDPYDYTD